MNDNTTKLLEEIKSRESLILSYLADRDLDDSTGWGTSLEGLIFDWQNQAQREINSGQLTDRPSGVILTGPDGCGKHTAMFKIVQILSTSNYGFAFLDGIDLPEFNETAELLNALFDNSYDGGRGLCIVLENAEKYADSRGLFRFLEKTVYEYWFNQAELTPLFLVLIGDCDLPKLLRDRLFVCQFTLPDSQIRRLFIEKAARDIIHYVSIDKLTSETAGLTFSQIRRVADGLGAVIDKTGSVSEETLESLTSFQRPVPDSSSLLAVLIEKLDEMSQRLPEILASIKPTSAQTIIQQAAPQPALNITDEERENMYADEVRKTRSMSIRELSADLWGEERANLLARN